MNWENNITHYDIIKVNKKQSKFLMSGCKFNYNEELKNTVLERITKEQMTKLLSMNKLRKATAYDYCLFLQKRSNTCTHFYNYDFPTRDFYVARKDLSIPPACGAYAINVIVPNGITVNKETWLNSHCNVFRMSDPDEENSFIPSYNNANQCDIDNLIKKNYSYWVFSKLFSYLKLL